jgi:DNA-binding beta-propeller fold protein YncE
VFDPADQYMYVISAGQPGPQGISTVLAISNTKVVGNVTVGNDALGLVYNPHDQEIYVALYGPNQVAVISGMQLVGDLNAGEGPSAVTYDPSNHSVYVVDYGFAAPGAVTLIPA